MTLTCEFHDTWVIRTLMQFVAGLLHTAVAVAAAAAAAALLAELCIQLARV